MVRCGSLKINKLMKPNELRIGNYVLLNNPEFWEQYIDKIVKIEGIDLILSTKEKEVWKDSFGSLKLVCKEETFNQFSQYVKPILLTEECVFELEDKYWDFVGYGTRLIYQDRLHPAIKIEKSIPSIFTILSMYCSQNSGLLSNT
jgi:hypothetical protein